MNQNAYVSKADKSVVRKEIPRALRFSETLETMINEISYYAHRLLLQ